MQKSKTCGGFFWTRDKSQFYVNLNNDLSDTLAVMGIIELEAYFVLL